VFLMPALLPGSRYAFLLPFGFEFIIIL